MRNETIARNYAEALLELARRAGDLDGWGAMVGGLSDAIERDPRLANFLAAPQIPAEDKKRIVGKAFSDAVPRHLVLFLQKLIDNRRQLLLPEIAVEYANLVDETSGRVHAQVTVAREASKEDRERIAAQLSKALGKVVVPHVVVNPSILGGVIVKVGDRVMDGSVRKRLSLLRGKLLAAPGR